MLASAVFQLSRAREPERINGRHMHAWLLDTLMDIDAELSDELYAEGKHKPFTVSALQQGPEGAAWFRITSMIPALTRILADMDHEEIHSVRLATQKLRLMGLTLIRTQHPWARRESFDELLEVRKVPLRHDKVRFMFASPTAFEGTDPGRLFPLPGLVFRYLADAWNIHSGEPIPEEEIERVCSGVTAISYKVETHPADLGRHKEPGFVGECEYRVPHDLHPTVALLAAFSFYCGIGIRATMGMGQCLPSITTAMKSSGGS